MAAQVSVRGLARPGHCICSLSAAKKSFAISGPQWHAWSRRMQERSGCCKLGTSREPYLAQIAEVCHGTVSRLQEFPFKTGTSRISLRTRARKTTLRRLSCSRPRKAGGLPAGSARAKNWLDDPFDYGPDESMEYGDLMSEGKQSAEEPRPPSDPNSKHGYLKFPAGYNVEIASLGPMIRNDVRRCCCIVAGGVYENLLFFPVLELLKDRYPGVKIDVYATERGKQTYEMNKNVRRAWVLDLDAQFLSPVVFAETAGKIKGEYYDMVVSTKLAGLGHSLFLWLSDSRNKISYVHPNVNGVGSGNFLSGVIKAPRVELAEGGYHMYAELIENLASGGPNVPRSEVPPLKVGITKKLKEVVKVKFMDAGVKEGDFVVFHGIESDSAASMQSRGDTDSLLPLSLWAVLAKSTRANVLFLIPNEKDRRKVAEACGDDSHIVFVTTPGQLAALIHASVGVVTTNTAALQLALALKKPSVGLFSSTEKAKLFVPAGSENCRVVASKTGKLVDLDTKAAIVALSTIAQEALVIA